MTWFGWALIGLYIVGMGCNVVSIGKKREPVTPTTVLFGMVTLGLVVVGILTIGTGHL